jgi:sulfane dehydrogenase subunit SoxC
MTKRRTNNEQSHEHERVAANGLLHRRVFLQGSAAMAGAAAALGTTTAQAQTIGAASPPWMQKQGAPFSAYGTPSHWRTNITRILAAGTPAPGREGAGSSRTPLHMLEGTITPAGLHYERHHNGVPDIDPDKHELMIHGMVRQPLVFNLNSLLRYPMETRVHYVECAGNSGGIAGAAEPQQVNAGVLHGLLSCSEWTGVKLSVLLQEAGLDPRATWLVAEGADSAAMSRSFPVWKANDDAMIALFQNGEPIRPEQGFPMRVLLPGFQGNTNVKWVRRIKAIDGPMHTRDETSRYSELMPDGKARQFMLQFEPKSIILKPSFGMTMQGPGYYEISGLAWSGTGRVRRVDVSADGGKTWAEAALTGPVQPKALTRFRLPWMWDGQPATLVSRTTDEKGLVQPARTQWLAQYAPRQNFHYNAMQAWGIAPDGKVSHVYV